MIGAVSFTNFNKKTHVAQGRLGEVESLNKLAAIISYLNSEEFGLYKGGDALQLRYENTSTSLEILANLAGNADGQLSVQQVENLVEELMDKKDQLSTNLFRP